MRCYTLRMFKIILIGVFALFVVGACVLGYMWYLTKNSQSVVHGGYDQKMQGALNKEQQPQ